MQAWRDAAAFCAALRYTASQAFAPRSSAAQSAEGREGRGTCRVRSRCNAAARMETAHRTVALFGPGRFLSLPSVANRKLLLPSGHTPRGPGLPSSAAPPSLPASGFVVNGQIGVLCWWGMRLGKSAVASERTSVALADSVFAATSAPFSARHGRHRTRKESCEEKKKAGQTSASSPHARK